MSKKHLTQKKGYLCKVTGMSPVYVDISISRYDINKLGMITGYDPQTDITKNTGNRPISIFWLFKFCC